MERRSPLRGRRTDSPPRPCRPAAPEVRRVARSGPDDLRFVELDVAVEQLAGRAQLFHGQAGILQLLHRAVRAEMEQRHRPSRNDAVPAAAARPAGQRRADARGRGVGDYVTLQWNAGIWAHLYDVYFGTEPDPPLLAANLALGPCTNARNDKVYKITGLAAGTAYYWRVVAKTMALQASLGPVSSFATAGAPPPSGEPDIVLYAAHAATIQDRKSTRLNPSHSQSSYA